MLKKCSLASERAEHEAGEGEVDEGRRVSQKAFVIFDQAPALGQPGEAALDDPAAGLDRKSFGRLGTVDDFEMQFAVRAQLLDPVDKLAGRTRVGPVFRETAKGERGEVSTVV